MSRTRFQALFEYECRMHDLVIESLATVPEDRRDDRGFRKAIDLFAHMMAARRIWLARLGHVADGPSTGAEVFPEGVALAALPRLEEAMEQDWAGYLGSLDEAELGRTIQYTDTRGVRYEDQVENVLTHLFGHSLYHRGQIAQLVRDLAGTPAATDLVFWTRRQQPTRPT